MIQSPAGDLAGLDARVTVGPAPRIAVVKLGALGDGIYAFPLVSALKAWRPAARITWIIEARLRDLPRLHPAVDRVITVDTRGWRADLRRGRWGRAWSGLQEFLGGAAGHFDVAVDAQGLLKSGAAAWCSRAPVRVGFAPAECRERGNAWAMTHHAPPAGRVHAIEKNLGLAVALGAPRGPVRFDFAIGASDAAWAEAWVTKHDAGTTRVVALHPGAGHQAKRWELARWIRLAERVDAELNARAIFIAGPGEQAAISAAASSMRRPSAVAAPPAIGALAALLGRAQVVTAGDTGPLHLAAAMGRPVVALYGPSDPQTAGPVGTGHAVIKYPCACGWAPGPAFNRHCADAACMAAIGVDEVVEAIERQLVAHSS